MIEIHHSEIDGARRIGGAYERKRGVTLEELIEIVTEKNGKPITTSLRVAEKFGKQHKDVLESIRNLTAEKSAAKLHGSILSRKKF